MGDLLDSYSPARGIAVARVEKNIAVSGRLEVFGTKATDARAVQIATTVNDKWTRDFPDGIKIRCTVSVALRAAGSPGDAGAFPVEIKDLVNAAAPSFVDGANTVMTLNDLAGPVIYSWVVAHEFGHVIKLADRYSESAASQASGFAGGPRTATVEVGYERNIMGIHLGDLESKNVGDLAKAKPELTTGWWDSDVQARNWIKTNSLTAIGLLSTEGKIRTLKILADGWIAEEDLVAMEKLLQSVTQRPEAYQIRNGFGPELFNTTGQRARIRLALGKLPGG